MSETPRQRHLDQFQHYMLPSSTHFRDRLVCIYETSSLQETYMSRVHWSVFSSSFPLRCLSSSQFTRTSVLFSLFNLARTMYTNNNPFGGWADASSGQTPSVFGALPYPSAPSASNLVTFYFTSFNPHVLNCTVLGPHSQPYFQVVTDVTMPGYTVIKNVKGSSVALIEWQAHPLIEIRGVLSKQNVGRWLRLSSDRRLSRLPLCTAIYGLFAPLFPQLPYYGSPRHVIYMGTSG